MRKVIYLISIYLGLFSSAALAQVIDDSTELVYGPETTQYTFEKYIKNNNITYFNIDTLLKTNHLWDPVAIERYYYQNLGTVGTGQQPVFYQPNEIIGQDLGMHAFDYYAKTPDEFRYFDTKSPFTNMRSVIGGNYRAYLGIDFSRNVTENWNVGFNFNRWTIDKQIGPLQSRGDLNVLSHSYDLFTDYTTPNGKYRVLANFARTYHRVYETGGIKDTTSVLAFEELFDYEDEDINLRNGEAGMLRQQYHVYHEYKLRDLVQIYHTYDFTNQLNQFSDTDVDADTDQPFFDKTYVRTDSTGDLAHYAYHQNELGLKGSLGAIFYRIYAKRKDIRYAAKYLPQIYATSENYAGAYARFSPIENWDLGAGAEYLQGNNYKLYAKLETPYFDAEALSQQNAPSFFYQNYFGNHDFWRNNFGSENVQELKGKAKVAIKDYLFLAPKASIQVISNYLYFNEAQLPTQASGVATLINPGVEWKTRLGNYHLDGDYVYTIKSGSDADLFRMPEHFFTADLYYEAVWLKSLGVRIGLEGHYKSAYFADGYDPVTQQFYLQNSFEVPGYIFADVYASFRFNTAKLFLKYRHVNQGLIADGYFTTPYYTGQQSVFDLGVSWSFFD